MGKHTSYKVKRARSLTASPLTPGQVAAAYNFPTGVDCSDRTVAILELGGMLNPNDVYNFCKQNKLKPPVISQYLVDGALESVSDADGEVSLDVCIVAAIAQGCRIAVVYGPNSDQGYQDALAKCHSLDPDSVSDSWGSPENTWDSGSMSAVDAIMKAGAEKGVPTFVAAGDNGSSDGEMGKHLDYPSSSPYAISCGGTRLYLGLDGTRSQEVAWSLDPLDGSGGGGGVSAVYPTPTWQNGILPALKAGRRSPDVSGNADPESGYQVEVDGEAQVIGGTSAVAPLMAALQALLNAKLGKHLGNLHTLFYAHPECFYDVTSGSNGSYKAGTGYDCCTGLGVVDAAKLLAAIG